MLKLSNGVKIFNPGTINENIALALDPKTAENIVEITKKLDKEHNLTTLMVTHDLDHAIELGTRTIMMDKGNIILNIKGVERKQMSIDDLLDKFSQVSGHRSANDRILLAQ